MALDIALNALIRSTEFCLDKNKNWSLISQHIPGFTPRQVYTMSVVISIH